MSNTYYPLYDGNGELISAQTAYDAIMNGNVYIDASQMMNCTNGYRFFVAPFGIHVIETDGEIETIRLVTELGNFYAGEEP